MEGTNLIDRAMGTLGDLKAREVTLANQLSSITVGQSQLKAAIVEIRGSLKELHEKHDQTLLRLDRIPHELVSSIANNFAGLHEELARLKSRINTILIESIAQSSRDFEVTAKDVADNIDLTDIDLPVELVEENDPEELPDAAETDTEEIFTTPLGKGQSRMTHPKAPLSALSEFALPMTPKRIRNLDALPETRSPTLRGDSVPPTTSKLSSSVDSSSARASTIPPAIVDTLAQNLESRADTSAKSTPKTNPVEVTVSDNTADSILSSDKPKICGVGPAEAEAGQNKTSSNVRSASDHDHGVGAVTETKAPESEPLLGLSRGALSIWKQSWREADSPGTFASYVEKHKNIVHQGRAKRSHPDKEASTQDEASKTQPADERLSHAPPKRPRLGGLLDISKLRIPHDTIDVNIMPNSATSSNFSLTDDASTASKKRAQAASQQKSVQDATVLAKGKLSNTSVESGEVGKMGDESSRENGAANGVGKSKQKHKPFPMIKTEATKDRGVLRATQSPEILGTKSSAATLSKSNSEKATDENPTPVDIAGLEDEKWQRAHSATFNTWSNAEIFQKFLELNLKTNWKSPVAMNSLRLAASKHADLLDFIPYLNAAMLYRVEEGADQGKNTYKRLTINDIERAGSKKNGVVREEDRPRWVKHDLEIWRGCLASKQITKQITKEEKNFPAWDASSSLISGQADQDSAAASQLPKSATNGQAEKSTQDKSNGEPSKATPNVIKGQLTSNKDQSKKSGNPSSATVQTSLLEKFGAKKVKDRVLADKTA